MPNNCNLYICTIKPIPTHARSTNDAYFGHEWDFLLQIFGGLHQNFIRKSEKEIFIIRSNTKQTENKSNKNTKRYSRKRTYNEK